MQRREGRAQTACAAVKTCKDSKPQKRYNIWNKAMHRADSLISILLCRVFFTANPKYLEYHLFYDYIIQRFLVKIASKFFVSFRAVDLYDF